MSKYPEENRFMPEEGPGIVVAGPLPYQLVLAMPNNPGPRQPERPDPVPHSPTPKPRERDR